jgi:intracellular septation protein A
LKGKALNIFWGWLFLALYLTTGNIYLATALGVATGAAQLAWKIAHRRNVDPLQWLGLGLALSAGWPSDPQRPAPESA